LAGDRRSIIRPLTGGIMSRTAFGICRLQLLLIALCAACAPSSLLAQEYPSKPIRWVIPYPTGGTSDFLARLIGQKLTEAWGQTVVVDNRTGANGNIGTEVAAKAVPDGYTLLLVASTFTMNPAVYPKLPFDTMRDFAGVTTILWQPYLLAVHPTLPANSVKQLVDLARAKPGEINYGSGGSGNATHIAAERFAQMAGVKLTHVPYRGVGPSILALLGGEVKLLWASSVPVQPHLKSGRIRVLAVTGRERIAAMPDIPTVAEAGVPGYVEGNWQMVLVPSRTPRPIVDKLNRELVTILKTPDVTAQILLTGSDVIANTPAQSDALVRTDLKKYGDLIKTLDIRVD
jgi:tripartite-type tricarboxylate transporter receptor subunit TctC